MVEEADVVIRSDPGKLAVSAGDINGDGLSDLLVGHSPMSYNGSAAPGAAHIFSGGNGHFVPTAPMFAADFSDTTGDNSFAIDNLSGGAKYGDGLWHLSERLGDEAGHSETFSYYYGRDVEGDYDTGRSAGRIISPTIDLTGVFDAQLSFNYFLETEDSASKDVARVWLRQSYDRGPYTETLLLDNVDDSLADPSGGWRTARVNLPSPFLHTNYDVQIAFEFDTVDSGFNAFEGFYVDDVRVARVMTLDDADVTFTRDVTNDADFEDRFGLDVLVIGNMTGQDTPADEIAILAGSTGTGGESTIYVVPGREGTSAYTGVVNLDSDTFPFVDPTEVVRAQDVAAL